MANLNWCRTCGKEYPVCPHCEQDARLNPWRMICDTEPHFLVWTAVNQYRQGIISKETAKADLSDTTQANITELISGKRGGQSTSALLNNFSVAEDAMKQALNSSGSAMRENQTYMDSLQAKLNQLDSAFQKFSTDLMKSDIPKFFVDLATVFVDGADNAVKFAGALPTLTAAISGVLSVMQMSGKLKNGASKVNMPSYI